MKELLLLALMMIMMLVLVRCAPASANEQEGPLFTTTATVSTVTLMLDNQSTEVICFLYVAPAGSGEWGESLLVGEVIMPGETGTFDVRPGTYDLRASNCFDVPLAEEMAVEVFGPLGWRITAKDL